MTAMTSAPATALLISEPPLQVIPSLAAAVGLNEAIILQQLHYWLRQPGSHLIDGRRWIYNTYEGWQEQFPFWSARTIQRALLGLEREGLVISTMAYNKLPIDKTKWYSVDYGKLDDLVARPSRQSGTSNATDWHVQHDNLAPPLPETTTETTTEISGTDVPDDAPHATNPVARREEDSVPTKPERSERQRQNDIRHERRLALFRAWCRGMGIDPESSEAQVGQAIAFRELKPIVDLEAPTPSDFEACTRYLAQQSWRDTRPRIPTVIREYAGWVAAGRPARETRADDAPRPTRATRTRNAFDAVKQERFVDGDVIETEGRVRDRR